MKPAIAAKLLSQTAHIEGWLLTEAGMLLAMVDEFQKEKDIVGDVFEIGVHHGKSATFFSNLLRPSESLHICDLFGMEGNASSSGSGNESIFKRNMEAYAPKPVTIYHKCLSSKLSADNLGKNYRFFHVDGGHNPDEALGDLILASKVLHAEGVIVLDDPFRVEWPGVTEALIVFLQLNKDFEAIVVGFNKILLARKSVASQYKSFVTNNQNRLNYDIAFPWEHKQLPFAGASLDIFFIPTRYVKLNTTKVRISKFLVKYPTLRNVIAKLR